MRQTSQQSARPREAQAADGPDRQAPRRAADAGRAPRLTGLARAALAPAFGVAIALAFGLPWFLLGREIDGRALAAMVCFAAAGTLSASLALLAIYLLRRRPFSARMAAALFLLLLGTAGLSTLFMTLKVVLTFHRLNEIPVEIAILILGIAGLGALYNVLTIAAPLILPLGLPATAVFAFLIARRPR